MADETMTSGAEKPEDFGEGKEGVVRRWMAEIKAYEQEFNTWLTRCPKILQRYRDETPGGDIITREHGRFNILWSNIQTLQPALYARVPKAEVRRRYKDQDPVGRAAAEILERCLQWSIDTYDYNGTIKSVRDDYLLCARGQGWVRYVPHKGDDIQDRIPLQMDDQGQYRDEEGTVFEEFEEDEDGAFAMSEPYQPIDYEEAVCDYINWEDFGHSPAPTWAKVGAVWKRELLTRKQLVERFGDVGKEVTLSKTMKGVPDNMKEAFGDTFKRAEVFEIWDKDTMKAIWISPGYMEAPLDELDDPLGLDEFFPCPKPLYGTLTTDKLVPVPDYAEYQSQAMELDRLTERIKVLTDALKVAGFFAGDKGDEIEQALKGQDNIMIPVANWAMVSERGGMDSLISWFPVDNVANVLRNLVEMREQIKRDLYELTGLSDIVRGQGAAANTTATEQRIKGQYAALRLDDRKLDLNLWIRDSMRLKAQIIAEHFDASTIMEMSGWMLSPEAQLLDKEHTETMAANQQLQQQIQQMTQAVQSGQMTPEQAGPPPQPQPVPPNAQMVFQEAVQLLRNDRLRTFRIDIETDSTIIQDEEAEKEARVQFMRGIAEFLAEAIPATQTEPALAPVLGEMLLFTVRGWKTGRQMESVLENALDQLKLASQEPKGPTPEQLEAQRQQQQDQERAKTEQMRIGEQTARAELDSKKAVNDGIRLNIEQETARAEAEHRQAEATAAENDRQRAHEIRMKDLELREKEVEARLRELQLQPARDDRKYSLDRQKMEQDRQEKEADRQFSREERETSRENEVEDRDLSAEEAKGALDERMGQISEALLGSAANKVADEIGASEKRHAEMMEKMDNNHEQMIKMMIQAFTAPRVIERDNQGRAVGAKIELGKVQ